MIPLLLLFLFSIGYCGLYVIHSFRTKRFSQATAMLILTLLLTAAIVATVAQYINEKPLI